MYFTSVSLCVPLPCSDLTHLSYLNEPGILHVLRHRYGGDTVYTTAGPVLVAVNPFKAVPLYGPEAARHYSRRGSEEAADSYEPHVFLTADQAYKQVDCWAGQGQAGGGRPRPRQPHLF